MCKRISILIIAIVLSAVAMAQKGIQTIPPRANVIAYANDDDILTNAYTRSPYYLQFAGDWDKRNTDSSIIYSRQVVAEKTWKDYLVCLNVRCGKACRVYVNGKEMGFAADSRQWNEFVINPGLKYGKTNTIEIEAMKESQGALLEDQAIPVGLSGSPYIIFKSDPGITDFTIVPAYDINASTGTFSVTCTTLCSKKKGRYYLEIELLDPQGHRLDKIGRWVVFSGKAEEIIDISRSWAGIKPWTAETPTLYTAILRLRDEDMQIEETLGARFGFRTVSVADGQLQINGKPVSLKCVSYGYLNPSFAQMESDVKRMKENNVNAVRTSKYSPLDRRFYELCDRYGLYVIADANLMPASRRGLVVAIEKDNIPLFEQRVDNLYGSLKNHTSIIAWSLGDCLDNGVCMTSAYKRMKQLDHSRPTISFLSQVSDIDLFDAKNALPHWPLQKDALLNLKHDYSPISLKPSKISRDEAEFIVSNSNSFLPLSNYSLQYTIYSNRRNNIISGDLPLSAPPQALDKVNMLLPPNLYSGEQLYIRFDATERSRNINANKVYSYSMPLEKSHGSMMSFSCEEGAISSNQDSSQITITSSLFTAVFDRATATLQVDNHTGSSYRINPPSFGGAPDHQPTILNTALRTVDSQTVCIDVAYRYPGNCDLRQTISIFASSDILFDCLTSTIADNAAKQIPHIPIYLSTDTLTYFGADKITENIQSVLFGQYSFPLTNSYRQHDRISWCKIGGDKTPLYVRQIDSLYTISASSDCLKIIPALALQTDGYSFRIHIGKDFDRVLGTKFQSYVAPSLPRPSITASSSRFSQPLTITISPSATNTVTTGKPKNNKSEKPVSPKAGKQKKQTSDIQIHYTVDGSTPTEQSPLYTEPFVIDRTTIIKAATFAPGCQSSFVTLRRFSYDHIASTTFSRKPNTPYNKGTDTILFDGELGSINDLAHRWLGFSGNPPEITVQLAQPIAVDAVELRFAHSPATWTFAPLSVEIVLFDTDGQPLDTISKDIPFDPSSEDETAPRVVELSMPTNQSAVKSILITPHTIDRIPDWHRAKKLNPWFMTDEIKVIEKAAQ